MAYNLLVILGPTAVGKTKLAAKIAVCFNGEIISADSRQVYRKMDIGTGKDLADYIVDGVKAPYHLIDIMNAGEEYNLYLYKQDFFAAYKNILKRGKLPILAGGTGLYLSSIVQNYKLNKADFEYGKERLQDMELPELQRLLIKLNPSLHNTTDFLQKERLIKAIQVAYSENTANDEPEIKPLVIGVNFEREIIKKRITERLKTRLDSGMIDEVRLLLDEGVAYDRLVFYGLEYKFIAMYLKGELSYNDMFQKLNSSIHSFAKRQMTWYRKMEKEGVVINWIYGPDFDAAKNIIEKGLNDFTRE